MISNKNIQIDAIETKQASTGNIKYIITSGKEKYQFWTTHKDGESDVYKSFKGMQPRKGDTVHIGFTEEVKNFVNNKGETVKYTERTIVGLREAGQGDVPDPREDIKPIESREAYGKRLAIHGMVNALLSSGVDPYNVKNSLPALFALEETIEKALNGQMPKVEENDIDVDSIPF